MKSVIQKHRGKIGGGLGLSASAVIFLYATFAQRADLEKLEERWLEDHNKVLTLYAIRENSLVDESKLYE